MSDLHDPAFGSAALVRSVEQDHSESPTMDKGATKAVASPEDARNSLKLEPKQNVSTEANTIVPASPNAFSNLASRGSSPVQEVYRGFRPPVNDARGYYANARRQLYGSSSPLQENRSPEYSPRSPQYVLRPFHKMEIPVAQSLARANSISGSDLPSSSAPRGRTIQRMNSAGRSKFPSSDAYTGVDLDQDSYDDDEDDVSDHGGRKDVGYGHKSTSLRKLRESTNEEDAFNYAKYISRGDGNHEGRRYSQSSFHRGEESMDTDNESSIFVQPRPRTRLPSSPTYSNTPTSSHFRTPRPLFSHDTLVSAPPLASTTNKRRKLTSSSSPPSRFNNPGASLDASRYSGDPNINWGLNQDPPSVPQNSVSDAALLKRGLTRGAKEKVCKRGYGANDPENVNIVNMKEDGLSFSEIVDSLNEVRVANGRNPSLSICGVTSRYNRTAPLLFAAEGRQFIPLSKRNKGSDVLGDGPVGEKPVWNDELDLVLVEVAKEVDSEKWGRVAKEYNRRTGKSITAAAAALRHTIL